MQRDIFTLRNTNMLISAFHGFARKMLHLQVPFYAGSDLPNCKGRSGSLVSWQLDPALVRNPDPAS